MSPTVDKSSDRVRSMFAQIAGKYDLMNHLLSLNIDRSWRRKTVRQVGEIESGPILDVCTGTGDLAFAFRQAHPDVAIVGTDFCAEMLDVARHKQRSRPRREIDFIEASTMELPFAAGTFEVVSVAFGIRNVENTEQGLREMKRVCRPGGSVAILEFSQPTRWPLSSIYRFYFKSLLPRLGQWLARNDSSAYEYLPSSVQEFPSGELFVAVMKAVGFTEIRLFPMTMGIATLYLGTVPVR